MQDLQRPEPIPHPEQTTSLFLFHTYSYLNGIINAANKVAHFPASDLPPLADYDRARDLLVYASPVRCMLLHPVRLLIECSISMGLRFERADISSLVSSDALVCFTSRTSHTGPLSFSSAGMRYFKAFIGHTLYTISMFASPIAVNRLLRLVTCQHFPMSAAALLIAVASLNLVGKTRPESSPGSGSFPCSSCPCSAPYLSSTISSS